MKTENTTELTYCSPMLAVSDPAASAGYYRDHLGFEVNGVWGDHYAIVERDGIQIHFIHGGNEKMETDTFRGGAYISLPDVDAFYREVKDRGADTLSEPQDTDYGMKEFVVRDPDAWCISFGERISQG